MKCLHVVGAAAVHLCAQGSWAALALFPCSHCFAQHIFTGSTKLSFTADHIWLSTHWKITKPPVGTVSRIFNSIRGKKKKKSWKYIYAGIHKTQAAWCFQSLHERRYFLLELPLSCGEARWDGHVRAIFRLLAFAEAGQQQGVIALPGHQGGPRSPPQSRLLCPRSWTPNPQPHSKGIHHFQALWLLTRKKK